MGTVTRLYRYPVKSAAAEHCRRLDLTPHGVTGDRVWAVADPDGTLVSAKHPRRGGRLLQVACRYAPESGTTTLEVPGAGTAVAGTSDADAALSEWLGRPVRLVQDASVGWRLRRSWPAERGLVPEWQAAARPGEDAVTAVAGPRLRHSFVDYGAVHVVTAAELQGLSAAVGGDVDAVRFRPNVVLDGVGPLSPGQRLTLGAVRLRVEIPVPRCVVPGLSPADGTLDADLLRVLAHHDRRRVGSLGTAACFGVYAVAEAPGAVHDGDHASVG